MGELGGGVGGGALDSLIQGTTGDVDSLHFGYLSRLPVVLVHKANDSVADYEPRKFQYICQRVSGKQELITRRRRRREEREEKNRRKNNTRSVCPW